MKKRILVLLLAMICIILCGFREKKTDEEQMETSAIQIQDLENIRAVQYNTIRMDAIRYGKDKISSLIDDIKSAVPVPGEKTDKIQRGEDYYTISLIYKDGTKDVFSFFEADDEWYMQTADGQVYENAGFATDYFGIKKASTTNGGGGRITIDQEVLSKEILELGKQFEEFDLRYNFAREVRQSIGYGESADEAISYTREKLTEQMRLYQYAVNAGYAVSEEKLTCWIESIIESAESAVNYDEAEEYFGEAGTTMREIIEKSRENCRITETISNMRSAKREEFKNGQDEINGKTYESLTDYWNGFMMDVVLPEAESYDMSSFLEELDEAEEFYHEQFD